MRLLLALLFILTGCTAPLRPALNDRFPDYCDVKQPDKEGGGYTVGQFPCKLTHHAAPQAPDKPQ